MSMLFPPRPIGSARRSENGPQTPPCRSEKNGAREAAAASGVSDGVAVVYCPHTTAGITINENADPDVTRDLLLGLDRAFPGRAEFCHAEGSSATHLKASCVGSSVTVIIEDGQPVLGTWQGVYFCEFDGPRSRRFHVKIIGK